MFRSLALTLALAAPVDAQTVTPAPSQPTLKLPAQIQAQPGQPFAVVAEGNCKWIRWSIPSGLVRVPAELTAAGDKGFVGYGPAGVYEFAVIGTFNDQPAESKCVVFVGQPQPVPPGPVPVPPPADSLTVDLLACYALNKDPDKVSHAAALSSLYRTAAAAAKNDQSVTTVGQLFAKLRAASKLLIPDNALHECRERLQREHATLGGVETPLTPELRAKAAKVFESCAAALGALR